MDVKEDILELKADVKDIKMSIGHIAVDIARNTSSLEQHMKRTEAAEERITKLENWALGLLASILAGVVGLVLRG